MRTFLCLIPFLVFNAAASGQTFEWGEELELRRYNDEYHHYDYRKSDRSFVVCITGDRALKAFETDSNLRVIRTWEYRWERGVSEVLRHVTRNGDSLELLMEQTDLFRNQAIYQITIHVSHRFTRKKLAEFNSASGGLPFLHLQRGDGKWHIWYENTDNRQSGYKMVYCRSYSPAWQPLTTDSIQLPYRQREIGILSMDVESPGNYLIYVRIYDGNKREKRGGSPNTIYGLLRVNAGDGKHSFGLIPVTSDSLFYGNMKFQRSGDAVYFYGTFSTRSVLGLDGILYGKANLNNPDSVVVKEVYLPDSLRFIDGNPVVKGLSPPELKDYKLTDLFIHNGELTIILEQRYVMAAGMSGGKTIYEYFYGDLLVARLDKNGFRWISKLEKHQKTLNDQGRFSSYALLKSDSTIRLLYNDRYGKGLFNKNKFTNPARFTLKQADFTSDGVPEQKVITDYKQFNGALSLNRIKYLGGGAYLCYGQRRKSVQSCFIRTREF